MNDIIGQADALLVESRSVKAELVGVVAEIRALRAEVARELSSGRYRAEAPILTQDEALEYVGLNSSRTFRRWASRFGVKPCSPGRYARNALDQGLRKEAK